MIVWPEDIQPGNAPVHVHNELEIDLEPAQVWPWLVRAARWSELYSNCSDLRIEGEPGPDLRAGSCFTWRTFNVGVRCETMDFVPNELLAWRGTGLGARGHHVWTLERRGQKTRFVTEETQAGIVPWLLQRRMRAGLLRYHQEWLEGLVRAARLGHPDDVSALSAGTDRELGG